MASLTLTQYNPITTIITMVVNLPVQNNVYELNISVSEAELRAIALSNGKTDWDTDDCCTFATNAIGIQVTV